ncbi:hypothetical protein F4775DRAFT_377357 [Biscogniauxia sp. FL1348]|nr:hypothetical protein F4775DRAFT_377357 [Biscogniauxia sp. FL1348]
MSYVVDTYMHVLPIYTTYLPVYYTSAVESIIRGRRTLACHTGAGPSHILPAYIVLSTYLLSGKLKHTTYQRRRFLSNLFFFFCLSLLASLGFLFLLYILCDLEFCWDWGELLSGWFFFWFWGDFQFIAYILCILCARRQYTHVCIVRKS